MLLWDRYIEGVGTEIEVYISAILINKRFGYTPVYDTLTTPIGTLYITYRYSINMGRRTICVFTYTCTLPLPYSNRRGLF